MSMRAYYYEGLDFNQNDFIPSRSIQIWQAIRNASKRLYKRFADAELRRREREQLQYLDERLLKDVGLTRFDIMPKINRPFHDQVSILR